MQIPYRKPGKYLSMKPDFLLTKKRLKELEEEREILINIKRPKAAAEVSRLAELGDFSENAEYQLAKGKLRGINNAILRLEQQINNAEIISPGRNSDAVKIGHTVTATINGRERIFKILGATEADPNAGIISYLSPIGAALIGRRRGEKFETFLNSKKAEITIIEIT